MPTYPPDGHAHTEWSWDAVAGSMEGSCARAAELGLPSIAFTDHVDFTRWLIEPAVASAEVWYDPAQVGPDGRLQPPPLDAAGYLACVQRCRDKFPGLRILSGAELGEPHWHAREVDALLSAGTFDRVLGSLHSLTEAEPWMIDDYPYERIGPAAVIRTYLAEALRLAESPAPFAVLAHIDYPLRFWPASAGPFDPTVFAEEYRTVLRALARSGRALEINTRVPLPATIVRWWHEAGGEAVSFGSDAHHPAAVANGFTAAAAVAEAAGFHPGRYPHDFWLRHAPRSQAAELLSCSGVVESPVELFSPHRGPPPRRDRPTGASAPR
jgi:histidinol-phosphatase (PHP family)